LITKGFIWQIIYKKRCGRVIVRVAVLRASGTTTTTVGSRIRIERRIEVFTSAFTLKRAFLYFSTAFIAFLALATIAFCCSFYAFLAAASRSLTTLSTAALIAF